MSDLQHQPEQPGQAGAQPSDSSSEPYPIRFYVEDPAGDTYEANAPSNTLVRDVAADFFEERGWASRDRAGNPVRAVVEKVNSDNPSVTKRLRGDQTLHDAGVHNGDTLRVLPESVAGAVNPKDRLRALVVDQREVQALAAKDPEFIKVHTDADHAPTRYEITLHYPGVKLGSHGPEITTHHVVSLTLPGDYPIEAPSVRWTTPIFHPNISAEGHVCLGVLAHRYLPSLGLAYIIRMLIDMVQYRNYDLEGVLNLEAAKWAAGEGQQAIVERLGGVPQERPLDKVLEELRQAERDYLRQRTVFKRINRFDQDI